MKQPAFKVLYVDNSSQKSKGIMIATEGNHVVIPRKGDYIQLNDERFVVEYIVHSFLKDSHTQVIEVYVINGYEFSMRK